ncbi:V-set domain-containing T-cell activation inhibitor 1-like [Pelobates cultripes]|uniref:V-set domain-containing T-cell activation inhibitor 1-like n=1 Tax=Pelobates cultripes TaxID=61616 RepID=A0AAD1STS9_PELCU|nr:V-set domain-containing T-cell activation inhibitor 1-like [Pelobates cultripes]
MAQPLFILVGLLLAFGFSQAKLDVIADTEPVIVKPGEKVQLKCILQIDAKQLQVKDFMIQWFTKGRQVAEFDTKITIDKPGLSLSEEALKKGDGTLTIASATVEDSGNYRCYLTYKSDLSIKSLVLKVDDPNKPKEDESFEFSDTVLTKKVDKVIDWFGKFDAKMDELLKETKKCHPQGKATPAK